MKILSAIKTLSVLCEATKKWGMYIAFTSSGKDEEYYDEFLQAAPYLNFENHIQFLVEGGGYILFDSEKEMEECYWNMVGDDGPTPNFIKERFGIKGNDYDGSGRIYAITCDPTGRTMNENT